jgi:hypothetical protein
MNVHLLDFPLDSSTGVACACSSDVWVGRYVACVETGKRLAAATGCRLQCGEMRAHRNRVSSAHPAADPATLSLPAYAALAVNIKDPLKCPIRRIHCARCKPATVTACSPPPLHLQLEMAMSKYPPGITTSYPRHKNNPIGSPIYTGGYGFTPIPMWVWVTHQVTRTHKS